MTDGRTHLQDDFGADEVVVELGVLPLDLRHELVAPQRVRHAQVPLHHPLHHLDTYMQEGVAEPRIDRERQTDKATRVDSE